MHREPLLSLLADYASHHPEESVTSQRFIDFVTAHDDCFERSLQIGHITGSAWVVDASRTKVLLTHHRKLNIWVQLGGHADGETDIAKVVMQEASEESGLSQLSLPDSPQIFDLDIHTIPARKTDPEHLHYDVRMVVYHDGDGDYQINEESHDLAWVEIAKLERFTDEDSMLRMKHKWNRSK